MSPLQPAVSTGLVQTISTYRLRKDRLEEFLRKQFPDHPNFNVKLSEDGSEYWAFEAPRMLTEAEVREINDNVRVPIGGFPL